MPGLKGKYDAWNRLVEVRDTSDNLIAQYEYNGLNQRIKKTVGSTTITKSFFNEKWQEIESVANNQVTSYVCGLRYIDDLVLREKGSERLYSLVDPNWNVVSICDANGNIQERYTYDAFGKRNVFDANFTTKTETDFNWNRAFTGQVLDTETGLMLYRKRYYHVGLGKFVSRDTIGYKGKDHNLYRYVKNKKARLDPMGTYSVYKPSDSYGDCVRKCEDDCYKQYINGWYWYPGMWLKYTGCVNGCKSGCANEDFTLGSYIRHMDKCHLQRLTCLCDVVGLADIIFDFIPKTPTFVSVPVSVTDCLCDIITAAQYATNANQNNISNLTTLSPIMSCITTVTSYLDSLDDFPDMPTIDHIGKNLPKIADIIGEVSEYAGRISAGDNPFFDSCLGCECQ
jgi:RHS repeat-associated protein